MSNMLDNIDGSHDEGTNWSGRFLVKVSSTRAQGLRIQGLIAFATNLLVNESDIMDAGQQMPIGKSLDGRGVIYTISFKNLSGGNSNDPTQGGQSGNAELIKCALGNEQFTLEVTERNMKKNRSDWMFRTIVLYGCTARGNIQLANVNERAQGPPPVTLQGTALRGKVVIGPDTYTFSGLL